MNNFNIDNLVTWTSGGGHGKCTTKTGNVIAIVKHGEYARDVLKRMGIDFSKYSIMFENSLPIADDVRYVVEVPHPGNGQPMLYFPHKGKLRLAE